jgi:hypothetical protein
MPILPVRAKLDGAAPAWWYGIGNTKKRAALAPRSQVLQRMIWTLILGSMSRGGMAAALILYAIAISSCRNRLKIGVVPTSLR